MEGDIPPFNAVSQTLIPFSAQTSSIRLMIASCKSIFPLLADFVEFYNYYKEKPTVLKDEFKRIIKDSELENTMINITEWVDCSHNINNEAEIPQKMAKYDCSTGRLLTQNGIFACPFLTNDYRGRMGSDFNDFAKSVRLETHYCSSCMVNKEPMFSINIC